MPETNATMRRVYMMARRIKGILFDLGDTLLDFGEVDIRSLFEAGARLAYDYLATIGQPLPSFARYHRRQLWSVRWNYFKSRFTRREFNALNIIDTIGKGMGQTLTREQVLELAWLWYQPLSNVAGTEPGLRERLVEFHQAGLTLGLVSNTFVPGEALDRHLRRENLLDLLPVRVYSCDVRYRKPDPRIFQLALDRSGLTAGETLFVGDSIPADIAGTNRMGMITVLKDPADKFAADPVQPTHRIAKLADLPAIVNQYNGG